MLDKLSTQQRLILAVAISVIFFIAYDYFFIPQGQFDNNSTQISRQENLAPQIANKDAKSLSDIKKQETIKTKTIATVEGDTFRAKIDDLGRISYFELKEEKYKDEEGKAINLINASKLPLPLEIRFTNTDINKLAFSTPYVANKADLNVEQNPSEIVLTQTLNDLIITKTIKFNPNGSYDLKVDLNKKEEYFITPGIRPDVHTDTYTIHGVILRKSDDSLEIIEDGDADGDETFDKIDLVSDSDRYYTTLFFDKTKSLHAFIQNDANDNTVAFLRADGNLNLIGYIGPKEYKLLHSINPALTDVVEYGWFTFIAKPMFWFLSKLHDLVGNWGWAIVLMTLIIRIILFPATYKGMISMNKLKDLAPKMKEIQTKYKKDPQKMNAQIMELYRKHNANPMGGCLPILIQIPIFFAMYRVLLNAIELKGAPWILWVHDLAMKDPYFILPILMGAAMFLQQRITPANFTDKMQEKIMKWLPVVFTFFFLTFPAGLTLYWFTNNVCSLIQQMVVNRLFQKSKEAKILEKQK